MLVLFPGYPSRRKDISRIWQLQRTNSLAATSKYHEIKTYKLFPFNGIPVSYD